MDVAYASGDEYPETIEDEQKTESVLRSVSKRQESVRCSDIRRFVTRYEQIGRPAKRLPLQW